MQGEAGTRCKKKNSNNTNAYYMPGIIQRSLQTEINQILTTAQNAGSIIIPIV